MKISNLELLKELGLAEGQVRVYTAVLELGISSLNKVQEKTGIERRNIYDILNKLIERGLITYVLEKGKRTYQCTHPKTLLEEVKKKQQALRELEQGIPAMTALFNMTKPSIRAEVYRGNESLKSLLNEALTAKEIFWLGGNGGLEKTSLKYWWLHWDEERIKKKIRMCDLADHNIRLTKYQKLGTYPKQYYELKSLPQQMSSPMVLLMFNNRVAQILWSKQSFAFVLESSEIKESFMRYFNYFWKKDKS